MKKVLFRLFLLVFSCSVSFPAEVQNDVPELLSGIWQGKDRLVMFSSQDNEFALVLRVFYQWYNDRTAEPASYTELKSRDRNNTTANDAEDIRIQYSVIFENKNKTAGVYELAVKYPHEKETVFIPVCVVDGKLYLDFLIKTDSDGFYRAASSASGITIDIPVFKKEVLSYFVHGNDFYKIRYWLSEMEGDDSKASFSDENQVFYVNKYLKIGGSVYQCTTGRSTKIRNIEKSYSFGKNSATDSENSVVVFGNPYLEKVPEVKGRKEFLLNLEDNNRRKKPAPKPLFPPSQINFHWKEISELEKYNPYTWNRRNLDIHK